MWDIVYAILFMLLGLLLGYLFARLYFFSHIKHLRSLAVKQSRSVLLGQVSEQLAPLLPDFPYHYKDAMFLGKGVDYIIFDGLHRGSVNQIIFLEVKRGTAQLNAQEKQIRDAVVQKKCLYQIRRL